ncbi:fibrillin-2-like [Oscarella lobularis]|uniref:fibrillin-2-like n=1 Tax=Oscarella lobularis TaxID=121494 RepID=UPI0033140249
MGRLVGVVISLLACFVVSIQACSEDVTVTERGTSVTSPNFRGRYPSSARCVTSLATQSPLYCLKFTLQFLDLESGNNCPYDRVKIKCGNTYVKEFCGALSSVQSSNKVVTCDKSTGEVEFRSDSSVEGRGFEIQVDRVRCSGHSEGQFLTAKSGVMTSPNYPRLYPNNADVLFHICLPSDCNIVFRFTHLNLEHTRGCTFDHVTIYNGDSLLSNQVGPYCHSHVIGRDIRVGNEALVRFQTDGSVVKNGFRLEYRSACVSPCRSSPCRNGGTCVETEPTAYKCCCPQGYTGAHCEIAMKNVHPLQVSGCVNSPNFPQRYPNSGLSDFVISANENERIHLRFYNFSMQNSGNCDCDRLIIYDGDNTCSTINGIFCGNVLPSRIVSTSNKLLLRFVSDDDQAASGFHLCYSSNPSHPLIAARHFVSSPCSINNGGCEQRCTVREGKARCVCRSGFKSNSDEKSCRDVDECSPHPRVRHNCVHPAECRNTLGSFYCVCNRLGFRLSQSGTECEDENECLNSEVHHCEQNCTNTIGSFYCSCRDGFRLSANGKECKDTNECLANNAGCSQLCINTPGSYKCGCRQGFNVSKDDNRLCIDVDECKHFSSNPEKCPECRRSKDAWYKCTCDEGHVTDRRGFGGCIDINECKLIPDICTNGTCVNIPGHYQCICPPGYNATHVGANKFTCLDIDECSVSNGGCAEICNNTVGSFTCTCSRGYELGNDGKSCIDINECASNDLNQCSQRCINTKRSYRCKCNQGYKLAGDGYSCIDIDECRRGENQCSVSELCVNSPGSYRCSCYPGWQLTENGFNCTDINECDVNNGGCQHTCINTPGNRTCECETGYETQDGGVTCQDINECLDTPCNMTCQNTNGSFSCNCRSPSFRLHSNGRDCLDIDECSVNNGGCAQICTNFYGGYECSCEDGYAVKPNRPSKCQDINECREETDNCTQRCHNVVGSYYCSCDAGYELNADNMTCTDVDECDRNISGCNQICSNEEGDFSCSCLSGYVLNETDSTHCYDVNECLENNGNCSGTCVNTPGSYRCECEENERLAENGFTCLTSPTFGAFEALAAKVEVLGNQAKESSKTIAYLAEKVAILEQRLLEEKIDSVPTVSR